MSRKKKRNASGMGSIRHRPDGNWEARYTEGVHPETGKRIRKSIYGKTQKEVRQALTKKLYEPDTGCGIGNKGNIALKGWLSIWLEEYSVNKKYSTLKGYRAQIKKHINPALIAVDFVSIHTVFIAEIIHQDTGAGALLAVDIPHTVPCDIVKAGNAERISLLQHQALLTPDAAHQIHAAVRAEKPCASSACR